MKNPDKKLYIKPLIFVAVTTLVLMTCFETAKQFIHSDITIWESHLITILFTTTVAVVTALLALRRYYILIRALDGIIPICADCKKIRNEKGYWIPIEVYIKNKLDTKLTHGICDECTKKYRKEIEKIKKGIQYN